MTAIYGGPFGTNFILVGDCLTSSEAARGNEILLPTHDNPAQLTSNYAPYNISGLCQKIYIVHPNLMVAWANSLIHARAVISELKQRLDFTQVSEQAIRSCLESSFSLSDLASVEMIFFARSPSGDVHSFAVNCGSNNASEGEGYAMWGGSGGYDLLNIVNAAASESSEMKAKVAKLFASLYGRELLDPSLSLANLYGGSYELAFAGPDGFFKFPEITFLFWSVSASAESKHFDVRLNKIIRNGYEGDLFFVRDISCSLGFHSEGFQFHVKQQTVHVIGSVMKLATWEDARRLGCPDLSSHVQCNVFIAQGRDQGVGSSFLLTEGKDSHLVRFTNMRNERFDVFFDLHRFTQETIPEVVKSMMARGG